jgi:hypothetical protein
MTTIVLIVAAATALAWPWIKEHAAGLDPSRLERHHYIAAFIIVAALLSYRGQSAEPAPPAPPPAPEALDLRGTFVGAEASADALLTAAICRELARELAWDGQQAEPFIKTGVAFDELRIRTRMLACSGQSLGDKHPRARQAIEQFLNAAAGTSGGPLTPETRGRWVAAYRDVAKAAEAAAR